MTEHFPKLAVAGTGELRIKKAEDLKNRTDFKGPFQQVTEDQNVHKQASSASFLYSHLNRISLYVGEWLLKIEQRVSRSPTHLPTFPCRASDQDA
jgi:hypothetical protein